ncbi:MAG TPA: hypothetical protein VF587_00575 [Solirubrobacteraceae bacterium]
MDVLPRALACGLLITLFAVSPALAAAPVAETTGTRDVDSGAATLLGRVDPNNEATRFFFEYGKTRRFGSRTADANAGSGANPRRVTARVEGLEPDTRYYFRLVASNASGVDSGATRAFKTERQPLGLQISAAPNPIVFGSPTTVFGTLTGTGNAGKELVLQQRPFPFTAEFAQVGNPIVTDGAGGFSFPVLPPLSTTQFRVRTTGGGQPVTSGVITLGVAPQVRTSRRPRAVRRNRRARVYGTIRPSRVGIPFEIQKQTRRGAWVVVRRGLTRAGADDTYARYGKRVRVPRTAKYRVFVNTGGGDLVSGIGPELTIRVRRR